MICAASGEIHRVGIFPICIRSRDSCRYMAPGDMVPDIGVTALTAIYDQQTRIVKVIGQPFRRYPADQRVFRLC